MTAQLFNHNYFGDFQMNPPKGIWKHFFNLSLNTSLSLSHNPGACKIADSFLQLAKQTNRLIEELMNIKEAQGSTVLTKTKRLTPGEH